MPLVQRQGHSTSHRERQMIDLEGFIRSHMAGRPMMFLSGRRHGKTWLYKQIEKTRREIDRATAEDATFENEFRLGSGK